MLDKLIKITEKILPIAIGIYGIFSGSVEGLFLSAITLILYYMFIIISDFIDRVSITLEGVVQDDNN